MPGRLTDRAGPNHWTRVGRPIHDQWVSSDAEQLGGRVLLIEDEHALAALVAAALRARRYEVVGPHACAEDALSALAAGDTADVVLMDIGLPGHLDGVMAAERLRDAGGPPVIFMTGASDDETLLRAARARPVGYLVKPVAMSALIPALELALRSPASRCDPACADGGSGSEMLLRLCAWCRLKAQGRDEQWTELGVTLASGVGSALSHGICPSCEERFKARVPSA